MFRSIVKNKIFKRNAKNVSEPWNKQSVRWQRYRGGEGAAASPDSWFVTYGAPVHPAVNIYA